MPRTPPYPTELRQQIVALTRSGRAPSELDAEFEPSEQTIRHWTGQAVLDEARRADGLARCSWAEHRDGARTEAAEPPPLFVPG